MADVVVFGSANADLVLGVPRIPGPGETVLASTVMRGPGGKGANQAVAAARSGASTAFLGALGADADGDLLRESLAASGVDTTAVRVVDQPTGLAVISLAGDAENAIVVAVGANAAMTDLSAAELKLVGSARVLLAQLEVPLDGVLAAARAAHDQGGLVMLNAAPSAQLPDELWAALDVLVVNEHEAADLLGDPSAAHDPERAVAGLLERVGQVVLTLGAAGARYGAQAGDRLALSAPRVPAVDTTAAGDTFCGVLAAALAQGRPIEAAMSRAAAAAALSVQREGAAASIPSAAEIDAFLAVP